jgi:hypothetical protein
MPAKTTTVKAQPIQITPAIAAKKSLDFRSYNTPKILRASMFAVWGLSVLWIPTSIAAIQAQRVALKTIAKDAIPSVLLSLRLVDAMSDMDAMVANALLNEKDKTSLIQNPDSLSLNTDQITFNKRRTDLADRLTLAAKNITFPGEEKLVSQLTLDFGEYLAYIDRAQAAHGKGDRATALAEYQKAEKLLDGTLIPKARELGEINSRELEQQYSMARMSGGASTGVVAVMGLMTIAALVALQLFLRIRTRRHLNPMLLGASLVALLFLLNTMWIIISSGEDLRVLKEDSYNSLLALRSGRSILYGANGDESRYLLDLKNAETHEKTFFKKTNQVFGQSQNQQFLTQSIQNINTKRKDPAMTGYFATAINNITFPAERTVLTQMMTKYQAYMAVDQQIRDLVASKRMPEAIALCVGDSNKFFDEMKDTMKQALDINQKVFDDVEQKANKQLANFEVTATIALGAMATLVFFGLRPRLREYD